MLHMGLLGFILLVALHFKRFYIIISVFRLIVQVNYDSRPDERLSELLLPASCRLSDFSIEDPIWAGYSVE